MSHHRAMGNASTALIELTALRGLSPRQSHRLTLEALIEGTLYDEALDYDWSDDHTSDNRYRLAIERRPLVQSGLAAEKFFGLHDSLVGERVFPSVEAPDASEDDQQALEDALREVGIRDALGRGALGLLYGSGCVGFHRVDAIDINGQWVRRFEDAALEATWCEPVFVSQVGSDRARAIAETIAEFAPQLVTADDEGWLLMEPLGSDSLDLAFLRSEWKVETEVRRGGGVATQTVITWYRRDYLPTAIVDYRPLVVRSEDTRPTQFEPLPVEPHGWGVVPAVWMLPPRTAPGAIDGPSFLTPQVRSLAQAADYGESFTQDAANYSCSPQMVMRDVKDEGASDAAVINANVTSMQLPATPRAVLRVKSTGASTGSVSLLETDGAAVKVGHERLDHLAKRMERLTGVIAHDQAAAAGTLSGTAMKRMLEPKLARVDSYRVPLGRGLMLLALKMARVLRLEGLASIESVDVGWPDVVELTADDLMAMANAFGAMVAQGIFPREAAIREIAKRLGRDDADELAAAVMDEEDERIQRAMDMASRTSQGAVTRRGQTRDRAGADAGQDGDDGDGNSGQ